MTCERVREVAAGYVLGALEPAEMAAVREHMDRCRKPHPELAELGGVLPYLAQVVEPVEPPASLKAAILAAAESDLRARRRSDAAAERLVASMGTKKRARSATPVASQPQSEAEAAGAAAAGAGMAPAGDAAPVEVPALRPAERPDPTALPARPEPAAFPAAGLSAAPISLAAARQSRRYRVLGFVASIAAAIAIVGLGVRVVTLQNDLAQAQHQLQVAQDRFDTFFGPPQPGDQVVYLRPLAQNGPGGQALLRSNGHLVLHMSKLAPTKGAQVYSLWVITPAAEASKLASFTVDASGIADLRDVGSVQLSTGTTLRVTLEPNDRAAAPSSVVVATGTAGS